MKPSNKEIESVSALSSDKRYTYFIKKVADWEECWGLYEDGWTLLGDEEGNIIFPLWPSAEYAQACATKNWTTCKPKSICLDELIDNILPELMKENKSIAAFIVHADHFHAITVTANKLLNDLKDECSLYD
jgi:hypothetical protein